MKLRVQSLIFLQILVLQVQEISEMGKSSMNLAASAVTFAGLFVSQMIKFDKFSCILVSEEQLDFPVLYASAKEGWASSTFTKSPPDNTKSMSELLDAIIRHVPPPTASLDAPFQMLVSSCL